MTKNFIKRLLIAFFVLTAFFITVETINAKPIVEGPGDNNTYDVTYNKPSTFSGTAPASQTKTKNVNLTLRKNNKSGSEGYLYRTDTTGENTFTVNFYSDGSRVGSTSGTDSYTTSYTVDGWSTSLGGSKAYELGGTYSGNATLNLYPHTTSSTSHSYSFTTASAPTKTGYTFEGWYTNDGTKVANANTVVKAKHTALYAHWTATTRTVTYQGSYLIIDGTWSSPENTDSTFSSGRYGKWSEEETVQYGGKGTFPDSPLPYQNYHSPNGGGPGYYIEFDIKRSITYDYNGGSGSKTSETIQPRGRLYFKFLGWSTSSSQEMNIKAPGDKTGPISSNVYYYALYEPENGLSYGVKECSYTLPNTTRDGYTLDGWYETGTDNYIGQPGDKPTTYISRSLYAKWTPDTTYYTITVEDRIGNSSGKKLGSKTYSVEEGLSANASALRNTTYTGYSYKGDSAEISSVSADVTI